MNTLFVYYFIYLNVVYIPFILGVSCPMTKWALLQWQITNIVTNSTVSLSNIHTKIRNCVAVCTFPMGLCLDDLTDSSWAHSILGRQSKLVPGTTFEVLQPIGALTGTDGKVSPLLAVVLRVLQDVSWRGRNGKLSVNAEPPCSCRNRAEQPGSNWNLLWSCLRCLQESRRELLRWWWSLSPWGAAGQVELMDRIQTK